MRFSYTPGSEEAMSSECDGRTFLAGRSPSCRRRPARRSPSRSIPIHPDLAAALKAGPANGLNLIGDKHGRPIARHTLTRLIRLAVEKAALPPECVAHGLRKAQMRRLAESGASTKQIAAVSGHRTLGEVARYTAAADQARLSRGAIAKLRPRTKRED
jgi:integrase